MNPNTLHPSAADFDFFIGDWNVAHKRLNERLQGCLEWSHFSGSSHTQKILGGAGNIDDNILHFPADTYHAVTLRTFSAETGLWSIWWLDGRHPDQIGCPMRGQFIDGVGVFYADEVLNGQAIRVRFLWTLPSLDQPRWEQAFSIDGGETWETNWVMDFTKK